MRGQWNKNDLDTGKITLLGIQQNMIKSHFLLILKFEWEWAKICVLHLWYN